MHRALLLLPLFALSLPAFANECSYSAARDLQDDLAGVRQVRIELNSHDMQLDGSPAARSFTLTGQACSSDQAGLNALTVSKHREGDQLIVVIGGPDEINIGLGGISYHTLKVQVQVPSGLPVSIDGGSGDAHVNGVAKLDAHTGSGDLEIRNVSDTVSVSAGSGDVQIDGAGSVHVGSVGSGDLKVNHVSRDVNIGSVGSGDVGVHDVQGSVQLGTLGSGDLNVGDVRGNLTVGAKGSGDITQHGVAGQVHIPHGEDDD